VGAEATDPKKVVLLSFFAGYCEVCKKELPFLSALYDAYHSKGLQILLINIDKDNDDILALSDEFKTQFPILHDRFNIVAKRYDINKLPSLFLINSDAAVAFSSVGYSTNISRDILGRVRRALDEPLSAPLPDRLKPFL
jgi:alkyl hydroperoxide reductase subunit AhpC